MWPEAESYDTSCLRLPLLVMQYMPLYLDHSKKAKTSINHWTTTVTSLRNQLYEFPASWNLRCSSFHSTFARVAHCTPAFAIVGIFQI